MEVLGHHIYEYQKGLRDLVLHTMQVGNREAAERKLNHYNIEYIIVPVTKNKINIFFGKRDCVDVVRTFSNKPLNTLTAEEDFILGIMLGYHRLEQCKRFLKRKLCNTVRINECEKITFQNFSDIGIA
ncbi:MAG: DUF2023 family protein [bacterium]